MNAPGGSGGLALLPRRALMALVQGYRYTLKPWLGNGCRFEPSCSAYGLQALDRHGAAAGTWLTAGRILRCHPWCAGGLDPVPEARPTLFTHLLGSASRPVAAPMHAPPDSSGAGPDSLPRP
jgi:putative membrane protein insertion efficiency factor